MLSLYITDVRLDKKIPKNSYLAALPLIRTFSELSLKARYLHYGDNGTGKSTLLEAIAISTASTEGGSRNFIFSTNDTHSELYKYVGSTVLQPERRLLLRASLYNVATCIDEMTLSLPHCKGNWASVGLTSSAVSAACLP